jgi:hypothetical protein
MQCAPVAARVFVLRQGFAGIASGEILKRFADVRHGARTLSERKVVRAKAGNPVPSGACSYRKRHQLTNG